MKCCKCGNGIESNRSFYPVEPPGKGRKWGCEVCIEETKVIKSKNECYRKMFCFICDDKAKCLNDGHNGFSQEKSINREENK